MSMTKAITLRLDPADYERLATQAKRLGIPRGALARDYVRAGLAENDETTAEWRRRTGLAALKRLAALRERLPDAGPVDVVDLIQEGREELDRRSAL